jgi:hypothetical protein
VAVEVCERLPQTDRLAQIVTAGAWVMEAVKRSMK